MKQHSAAVSEQAVSGRTLDGRYRLEGEIGSGGLGVVYRATHEKLERAVAVKLLHAHCGDDPVLRTRFEREAKALAALDHPNIVRVTDYGVEGDTPYLVMELLEGQSLAERMAQGALDEANAHELALPLLSALAYVHGAGLVHRDVKPGNVFLQRTKEGGERLKLLDFGLAKFTLGTLEDASVTRSGAVLGTPAYMSPEQASGDTADARSDVYAAGVLVLEMLAGRTPFSGDAIDQLRGHLVAEVPKLAELHPERMAHPELDAFIQRALSKRPSDRFADAGEMKKALEALPRPWFTRVGSARADEHARTIERRPAATVDMSSAADGGGALAKLAQREVANDARVDSTAAHDETVRSDAGSQLAARAGAGDVPAATAGADVAANEHAASAASARAANTGGNAPGGAASAHVVASGHATAEISGRGASSATDPRSPSPGAAADGGGTSGTRGDANVRAIAAADGGDAAQRAARASQLPTREVAASAHDAVAFREGSPDLIRDRNSKLDAGVLAARARRRRPWLLAGLLLALAGVVCVRLAASPFAEPAVWAAVAADGMLAQASSPAAVSGVIPALPMNAHLERSRSDATPDGRGRSLNPGALGPDRVAGPRAAGGAQTPNGATPASTDQPGSVAPSPTPGTENAPDTGSTLDGVASALGLSSEGPQLTAAGNPELPEAPDDGNADAVVRHPDAIESERDVVPPPPPPSNVHRVRAPARNPWQRTLPKDMKPLRAALARGGRGNDHVIANLRRYNREHPDDARGHLLLANLYANREWRADALDQYTIAYQIDPGSRGAPEMLPELLSMVWRGSAASGASRLIEQAYRNEALPAIARALHAHRDNPRATARLLNLRARIAAR